MSDNCFHPMAVLLRRILYALGTTDDLPAERKFNMDFLISVPISFRNVLSELIRATEPNIDVSI